MKTLKLTIISTLFLSLNLIAQDTILNRSQFDKIENKQYFFNRPLSEFLKTLKLDIKSVSFQKESEEGPNRIILRFDDRSEYGRLAQQNISPARITVYFIENEETKIAFYPLNQYGTIEGEKPTKKFENLKIQKIIGTENKKMTIIKE